MSTNTYNAKAQMRKGILEYCILLILSKQDMYASDIINQLKQVKMIVVEGTLYPLLMRHKNAGLLAYRWEESTQGPPRKYYAITDSGRQFLEDLDASWNELVDSVSSLKSANVGQNNAKS
jgi:PadR family transcriptional regulator, regulatory protein PadR